MLPTLLGFPGFGRKAGVERIGWPLGPVGGRRGSVASASSGLRTGVQCPAIALASPGTYIPIEVAKPTLQGLLTPVHV